MKTTALLTTLIILMIGCAPNPHYDESKKKSKKEMTIQGINDMSYTYTNQEQNFINSLSDIESLKLDLTLKNGELMSTMWAQKMVEDDSRSCNVKKVYMLQEYSLERFKQTSLKRHGYIK